MDPNTNPFNPGAGFPPPELVGRDYLSSEFRIALGRRAMRRHGKHMLLIGLRGVGKTVLLNHACDLAKDMDFEVVVGETDASKHQAGAFTSELAQQIGELLPRLTKGLAAKVLDKIRQTLSSFSMTFSPDGPSLKFDADTISTNINYSSGSLTNLFVAVGEAAAERRKGILVAIDEVQDLPIEDLSALIAAAHRADQMQLPILLIGAGLPNLPGKACEAKSYSERLFQFPPLRPLTEDDAKAALLRPTQREGVNIQNEALEHMVEAAEGYPYFIQEWGNRAWDVASGNTITVDDAKAAELLVEASLDENFYSGRTSRLTPKEIEYLHAMAQLGPGPHSSGEIAKKLGATTSNVSVRRKDLIEKGMIHSPAHGELAFSVPMFDKYLKRVLK